MPLPADTGPTDTGPTDTGPTHTGPTDTGPTHAAPAHTRPTHAALAHTGPVHTALRPIWLCRACAAPWPCATARLTLCREYADDPLALRVYLCTLLYDAAADLYRLNPHDGPDPQDLFNRFLAWASRVRGGSSGADPGPPPTAPR